MRATIVLLAIMALSGCSLSDEEVLQHTWKFNDDQAAAFPHCDIISFGRGGWDVRNDTIFRSDTTLATIERTWRYGGRDRLSIKILATGKVVEYVSI